MLRYNQIELACVLTEGVEQSSRRDPSGTDDLFTDITISVEALVGPGIVPDDPVNYPNETAAAKIKRLRHELLKKRQSLTYAPNGNNLVDLGNPPDENNGPEPLYCNVVQISPTNWIVKYAVRVCVRECMGLATQGWLSNRWSDTTDYDSQWRCTRKRNGVLILSGANGENPESFRGLVTPGVPQGFRREQASYALDETGLVVRYSFTDKELFTPPPDPAFKMTGRMVESVPMPGAKRVGEFQLRLSGPKGANKKDMLSAAIRIGMSRVYAAGTVGGRFIAGGSIGESLNDDENAIDLTLSWMMAPSGAKTEAPAGSSSPSIFRRLGNAAGDIAFGPLPGIYSLSSSPSSTPSAPANPGLPGEFASWLGKAIPGSDPNRSIAPPTRGLVDHVRLVAAALGDPCGATIGDLTPSTEPNTYVGTPEMQAELNGTSGGIGETELRSGTLNLSTNNNATELITQVKGVAYEDDTPGVYEVWVCTNHYTDEPGEDVLPSTRLGDPAQAVRFHAGIMSLRCEFSATRMGGPPVIPSTEGDDNAVFCGGTLSPETVDLTADGSGYVHTVTGVYNWKFLDRTKVVTSAPVPPWLAWSGARAAALESAQSVSKQIAFPADAGGANGLIGTALQEVSLESGGGGLGQGDGPTVNP